MTLRGMARLNVQAKIEDGKRREIKRDAKRYREVVKGVEDWLRSVKKTQPKYS
jgi:hypothetical protein